jgi:hypothetical protein
VELRNFSLFLERNEGKLGLLKELLITVGIEWGVMKKKQVKRREIKIDVLWEMHGTIRLITYLYFLKL